MVNKETITKFVNQLQNVVKDIETGKYDSKLEESPDSELNEIISSVNPVLDDLKSKIKDLNNSKIRYQTLYDGSPDLHRSANNENIIIDCNQAYADYFGYTKDEAIGMSTFDHLDERSFDDFKKLSQNFQKTDKAEHFQLWFKRKDGSTFPGELSSIAVYDLQGNIIGSTAVIQDISDVLETKKELKEATEVRNKSELKYRNLYDNASDLYRVANKNGVIIDCNKAYAETLGYTKDEIIGNHSTLDHTASVSIDALKKLAEDWQKTKRVMNREIWLKRKDGTTFPCLVSSTALHDEAGELIGSNTIIKDITEIYVARKRIEELEKQLGQQGQLKAQ